MRISGLINVLRWFVVATTVSVPIGAAASGSQPPQSLPDDTAPLVIPARRSHTSPPASPAALPPAAEQVTPLTLNTQVRRQAGKRVDTVRQTVTRTADRVHVASSDGREWLFERNTRDGRRAFGTLIDHRSRALVFYDESDLRNMLGIRGWAQVLSLGLDHELLQAFERRTEARAIDAVRVVRHVTDRKDAELREVWWSDTQFLPGAFTSRQGPASLRFLVERVRSGVDAALLRPAAERFPKYRQVDLAEWLER